MPTLGRFGRQLRSLMWKASVDEEVDAELAFHIEMRTRELVAQGMRPDAARAAAVQRLGDLGRLHSTLRRIGKRRDRHMQRIEWTNELRQDASYALRQLAKSPGFSTVAVLTLALGIGASTAIFSALNTVVLTPLPYPGAERLVRLYTTVDGNDQSVASGNFVAWREQSRSFRYLVPYEYASLTLIEGGQPPEQLQGARVSHEHFPMLGIAPARGRTFLPEEDVPGRDRVAVLSHRLWTRRFNSDPAVLGRSITLNSLSYTIVGVMPPAFELSSEGTEIYLPIAFTPEQRADLRKGYLVVIGRLKPEVTIEKAQSEMTALARVLRERFPEPNRRREIRVASFMSEFVGPYRARLFTLLGAVGFVLLIACGNVANLLLARGAGRRKEIALRTALGAGRARVLRQLLTESLVLGILGAAAGVALAALGVKLLVAASPDGVPRLENARIDALTLAFTMGLAVASSLVFGLLPALHTANANIQGVLREGGRGVGQVARDRVRKALVVLEVALSLVLLVGAGLLIRSAVLLQRVQPGFDPTRVFTGWITLPASEYPTPERIDRTFQRVVEEVGRVPGVESAAVVSLVPMFDGSMNGGFLPEGREADPANSVASNIRLVSPGYFGTMRIPLRQGRAFTDRDVVGSPQVIVLNEAAAKKAWPGENPIGKRVSTLRDQSLRQNWWEVVGVAGDVRSDGLREEVRPEMYLATAQVPAILWDALQRSMFVVARTTPDPLALSKPVKEAVMRVDATLPVFDVRSMEQRLADSLATARFNTLLLALLGAMGLLLAAVGIYGVIAYFVSQRTQEIGVRIALGATPQRVVGLVVAQGMRPVLLGIALGAAVSMAVTRVLASVLYGVKPTDPLTFAGVAATIALVAMCASLIPARRAARVDPSSALQAT